MLYIKNGSMNTGKNMGENMQNSITGDDVEDMVILEELIDWRDTCLTNYYLNDSVLNLGLYNKSVNNIKKLLELTGIKYDGIIDMLDNDYGHIIREYSDKETFDLTDINEYNTDFEVD